MEKTKDTELRQEMDKDYPLIPMMDITDEARLLAVAWVEGYEYQGMDIPGKQKLASDIMNYCRRQTTALQQRVKELEELCRFDDIPECIIEDPGFLKRWEDASKVIDPETKEWALSIIEADKKRRATSTFVEVEESRYHRLIELEKEGEWVSVETPPDCHITEVLKKKKVNWVLGFDGKIQFICVHTKGHELEYGDDDPPDNGEYDEIEEKNGCLYLKPGWYSLEETPGGEFDEMWVSRKPLFWRPLPPPPGK